MARSQRFSAGRRRALMQLSIDPQAVRRARLEAGLRLSEVAGGSLSPATIRAIEIGRISPSLTTLGLIAERTGRPLSYFLADGGATREQRAARDQIQRLVTMQQFEAAVEQAGSLLAQRLSEPIEAGVRLAVGTAHVRLGDGARAYPHLVRARELAESLTDHRLSVEALSYEASALYLQGDVRTLDCAFQALALAVRLKPEAASLVVRISIVIGQVFLHHRRWSQAAEYYHLGLRYAKAEPNLRMLCMLHIGLGAAYQAMGKLAESLDHSDRAYRLAPATGDPTDIFRAEHNRGELLLRMRHFGPAAEHFGRALMLCEQHGFRRNTRAFTLCSLAEVHLEQGRLPEARAFAEEALALARELDERLHQGHAYRLLGRLRIHQGDLDAAEESFARAIAAYQALRMPLLVRDCHAECGRALQKAGRLSESITHWRAAAEAVQDPIASL